MKRHYGLVNRAADQVAELGMLDRASLGIGKPTKKALEAIEAGDSYIAIAQEFQAHQKAIKARERTFSSRGTSCATRKHGQSSSRPRPRWRKSRCRSCGGSSKPPKRRAAKADELAATYLAGRDQAIDELRALRPQHGHGLGY